MPLDAGDMLMPMRRSVSPAFRDDWIQSSIHAQVLTASTIPSGPAQPARDGAEAVERGPRDFRNCFQVQIELDG